MCVTHLAQVAACAEHQLLVKKEQGKDSTHVQVKSLKDEARTREIARMLGSASSSKSLAHARELLRSEEHTSELQSRGHLVCRLLLEEKNRSARRDTKDRR